MTVNNILYNHLEFLPNHYLFVLTLWRFCIK